MTGRARHRGVAIMVVSLLAVAAILVCPGSGLGQAEAAGDALFRPETQYVPLVLTAAAEAGICRNLDGRAASVDAKATTNISIWKTIVLGTFKNARALREALLAAHCRIGDLADEILYGPDIIVNRMRTVDLVVLSVAALGFGAEGASLADIYARAGELGLELCPVEVAPQLRLQYLDQPLGEFLHIAMEPITT